jgi:hypothetical protein
VRRPIPVLQATAALVLVSATGVAASPQEVDPLVQVSPTGSPFRGATAHGPPCAGVPPGAQTGRNFPGTAVEPWVVVNPANPTNLVGGWQQDRWSNGGATALVFAYTQDAGRTWHQSVQPKFTRCTGGTAANGGDYERASDPWVSIAPNGHAYAMSLSFDAPNDVSAMLVATSTDGGRTWGPTVTLRRDTSQNVLNDKNSLTADNSNANYAYTVWDRLEFPTKQAKKKAGEHEVGHRGPTWFSRTTDSGASWEPAHMIYDPGEADQTIGNRIVQTRSGALVNGFDLIYNIKKTHKVSSRNVAVLRSTDRGATWTSATIVDKLQSVGVKDPTTGKPVRTGDMIPELAVDPRNETVYAVWQDARSTGGARDQIAIAKSTDGGSTWTTGSFAINKVHLTQAFNPAIRVQPDGTIGVLYQDFRDDDGAAPLVTSTWLLQSHDGGNTWDETKVGADFNMTGAPVAGGYFLGDYMGLGATSGAFHLFFARATGSAAVPASNIYSTTFR